MRCAQQFTLIYAREREASFIFRVIARFDRADTASIIFAKNVCVEYEENVGIRYIHYLVDTA